MIELKIHKLINLRMEKFTYLYIFRSKFKVFFTISLPHHDKLGKDRLLNKRDWTKLK